MLHPALSVALGAQGEMPQLFQPSGDCIGCLPDALPLADKLKHRVKEREWGCMRSAGDLYAAAVWSLGSYSGFNLQIYEWTKYTTDR